MDGNEALTSALWTSLGALIPVLPPPRVVPALQRALRDLLEEPAGAPHKPATPRSMKRSRSHSTGNLEVWGPLRTQLVAALASRGMSRGELAAAVRIPPATLKPSLCPRGQPLGAANRQRLERWLKATEARPTPPDSSNNGSTQPAAEKTGEGAPVYTLTTAQREKLAVWRSLEPEKSLRAEVGLAAEIIDQAISGAHLNAKVITRLTTFLAEHATPS